MCDRNETNGQRPIDLQELRRRRAGGAKLVELAAEVGVTRQKLDKLLRHGPRDATPAAATPEPSQFFDAGEHSQPQAGVFGQTVFEPATGRQQAMFGNPLAVSVDPRRALVEKYRPRQLSELVGQDEAVAFLRSFVAGPYPTAFVFEGDTGTGKTSASLALAAELGCDVDREEFGGVRQIASGDQSADAVRALPADLALVPFYGSGWRVCVINEADRMHPQAEVIWLDLLEKIPPRTVIVFTTNNAHKLSRRFKDRCQVLSFTSDPARLGAATAELVRRVWEGETGRKDAPDAAGVAGIVEDGQVSFRRAVQAVARILHTKAAGL